MVKITKEFISNPSQICVLGICCEYDLIFDITNLFSLDLTVITIDSVSSESLFVESIKESGLQYHLKSSSTNQIEMSVLVPIEKLKDFLKRAIKEAPENIFLYALNNSSDFNETHSLSIKELFSSNETNVFISVSFDENAMAIFIDKSVYNFWDTYKNVKKAIKSNKQ